MDTVSNTISKTELQRYERQETPIFGNLASVLKNKSKNQYELVEALRSDLEQLRTVQTLNVDEQNFEFVKKVLSNNAEQFSDYKIDLDDFNIENIIDKSFAEIDNKDLVKKLETIKSKIATSIKKVFLENQKTLVSSFSKTLDAIEKKRKELEDAQQKFESSKEDLLKSLNEQSKKKSVENKVEETTQQKEEFEKTESETVDSKTIVDEVETHLEKEETVNEEKTTTILPTEEKFETVSKKQKTQNVIDFKQKILDAEKERTERLAAFRDYLKQEENRFAEEFALFEKTMFSDRQKSTKTQIESKFSFDRFNDFAATSKKEAKNENKNSNLNLNNSTFDNAKPNEKASETPEKSVLNEISKEQDSRRKNLISIRKKILDDVELLEKMSSRRKVFDELEKNKAPSPAAGGILYKSAKENQVKADKSKLSIVVPLPIPNKIGILSNKKPIDRKNSQKLLGAAAVSEKEQEFSFSLFYKTLSQQLSDGLHNFMASTKAALSKLKKKFKKGLFFFIDHFVFPISWFALPLKLLLFPIKIIGKAVGFVLSTIFKLVKFVGTVLFKTVSFLILKPLTWISKKVAETKLWKMTKKLFMKILLSPFGAFALGFIAGKVYKFVKDNYEKIVENFKKVKEVSLEKWNWLVEKYNTLSQKFAETKAGKATIEKLKPLFENFNFKEVPQKTLDVLRKWTDVDFLRDKVLELFGFLDTITQTVYDLGIDILEHSLYKAGGSAAGGVVGGVAGGILGGLAAGATSGALAGTTIGSLVPGLGNAVGFVVGGAIGILGAFIGGQIGSDAYTKRQKLNRAYYEPYERKHANKIDDLEDSIERALSEDIDARHGTGTHDLIQSATTSGLSESEIEDLRQKRKTKEALSQDEQIKLSDSDFIGQLSIDGKPIVLNEELTENLKISDAANFLSERINTLGKNDRAEAAEKLVESWKVIEGKDSSKQTVTAKAEFFKNGLNKRLSLGLSFNPNDSTFSNDRLESEALSYYASPTGGMSFIKDADKRVINPYAYVLFHSMIAQQLANLYENHEISPLEFINTYNSIRFLDNGLWRQLPFTKDSFWNSSENYRTPMLSWIISKKLNTASFADAMYTETDDDGKLHTRWNILPAGESIAEKEKDSLKTALELESGNLEKIVMFNEELWNAKLEHSTTNSKGEIDFIRAVSTEDQFSDAVVQNADKGDRGFWSWTKSGSTADKIYARDVEQVKQFVSTGDTSGIVKSSNDYSDYSDKLFDFAGKLTDVSKKIKARQLFEDKLLDPLLDFSRENGLIQNQDLYRSILSQTLKYFMAGTVTGNRVSEELKNGKTIRDIKIEGNLGITAEDIEKLANTLNTEKQKAAIIVRLNDMMNGNNGPSKPSGVISPYFWQEFLNKYYPNKNSREQELINENQEFSENVPLEIPSETMQTTIQPSNHPEAKEDIQSTVVEVPTHTTTDLSTNEALSVPNSELVSDRTTIKSVTENEALSQNDTSVELEREFEQSSRAKEENIALSQAIVEKSKNLTPVLKKTEESTVAVLTKDSGPNETDFAAKDRGTAHQYGRV